MLRILIGAFAATVVLAAPARLDAACEGIAPAPNTTLTSIPVVTGLTGRPHLVTAPPGDTGRLFIVQQDGPISIWRRGDPAAQVGTFLDLTGRLQGTAAYNEMGLLGLAFDPDYAANGRFYVVYTEGMPGGPWFVVLARYLRSASDPDAADPGSEARLLRIEKTQTNHNGGQIFFGPDGFLYMAAGDGGGFGDQHGACGNGQNLATLLGKLLRLDVRGIDPAGLPPDCGGAGALYTVPAANPFAGGAGGACDEVWAYGLRNPWRSAFDPLTGDLFVADVGQRCWEEVNHRPAGAPAGANFGWRQMEGSRCYNPALFAGCDPAPVACAGSPPCQDPSLVLPIFEYGHVGGACSITGGPVYRGCRMPAFAGFYFHGDYCAGTVGAFRVSGGVPESPLDLTAQVAPAGALAGGLTGFGTDGEGEIYILDRDGTVLKIAPPFADLEVSGEGSASPLLSTGAGWNWEDLEYATMHPVTRYRVYRGTPGGVFTCIYNGPGPQWPAGDPFTPAVGSRFAYVVTAIGPGGEETRPGIAGSSFLPGSCL